MSESKTNTFTLLWNRGYRQGIGDAKSGESPKVYVLFAEADGYRSGYDSVKNPPKYGRIFN